MQPTYNAWKIKIKTKYPTLSLKVSIALNAWVKGEIPRSRDQEDDKDRGAVGKVKGKDKVMEGKVKWEED